MAGGSKVRRDCKSCNAQMLEGKKGEWKCYNCGRQDCVVEVGCVNVKAVPMNLRGTISPMHKALLEIIEEHGVEGVVPTPKMIEELNKRGFKGVFK